MLVLMVLEKRMQGVMRTRDGGGSSGQEESAEDVEEHCEGDIDKT
jgi:hypothetical protein